MGSISTMSKNILSYYNSLNIAKKLRFMGISTTIITAFIAITLVLVYQYVNEKNSIENANQTLTKILAQNIAPAFLFSDNKHIKESLQSLIYEKKVINAYVMNLQWKIVESYSYKDSNNTDMLKILTPNSKQSWHNSNIYTVEPITIDGKDIGSLVIVASIDDLMLSMIQEAFFITLLISLAIILTFRYHSVLSREILNPISKLNDSTNTIIKTKTLSARVDISNNDEIGELAKNFNIMIQELSSSRDELNRQKDLLAYKAHHDELTGLPNRALFYDRLDQAITKAKRHKTQIVVLFLDIDYFKQVNDTYGHDIGDEVIKIFADRLRSSTREEDTIARMGGDEFMIILENQIKTKTPIVVAQKILDSMLEPLNIVEEELIMGASIGISVYPKDGQTSEELIKSSDIAMYEAKNDNRNNFKFYAA